MDAWYLENKDKWADPNLVTWLQGVLSNASFIYISSISALPIIQQVLVIFQHDQRMVPGDQHPFQAQSVIWATPDAEFTGNDWKALATTRSLQA